MTTVHHLMGLSEIARRLGVSRQRVLQLVDSYADFPAPTITLATGRVWESAAVEKWLRAHPDRPTGKHVGT